MEWYQAIVLGLIQGLTEFLPVSSSGHLLIGRELLGVDAPENLVFETMVHAATVLSTIIVFWKPIVSLLKGLFKFKYNDETDYILKICVSMIPILIVGVFFKDFVEGLFGSLFAVGCALIITAILLFFSDMVSGIQSKEARLPYPKEYRNGISYWQAFVAGVAQAVAVVPGLSRSGTTISTGLICGVKRDVMAQFSFLMVLVPILGESFLDLVHGEVESYSLGTLPLLLGFLAAFIAGLFACKVMVSLVKKAKLKWFALYCAVVAILLFIFA